MRGTQAHLQGLGLAVISWWTFLLTGPDPWSWNPGSFVPFRNFLIQKVPAVVSLNTRLKRPFFLCNHTSEARLPPSVLEGDHVHGSERPAAAACAGGRPSCSLVSNQCPGFWASWPSSFFYRFPLLPVLKDFFLLRCTGEEWYLLRTREAPGM